MAPPANCKKVQGLHHGHWLSDGGEIVTSEGFFVATSLRAYFDEMERDGPELDPNDFYEPNPVTGY